MKDIKRRVRIAEVGTGSQRPTQGVVGDVGRPPHQRINRERVNTFSFFMLLNPSEYTKAEFKIS